MAPTLTVLGLLDLILPKYSDFRRSSTNIAILDVIPQSEMKYDGENWTGFLGDFTFGNFCSFSFPKVLSTFFH